MAQINLLKTSSNEDHHDIYTLSKIAENLTDIHIRTKDKAILQERAKVNCRSSTPNNSISRRSMGGGYF